MSHSVNFNHVIKLNNSGEVCGLEFVNCICDRLLKILSDALSDESTEVDRAAKNLNVSLLKKRFITIS
jgi:uncharacterized protein YuzE